MSENERLPNEISVWAVGVGNLPMTPNPFVMKRASKAMKYIKGLKGFLGVSPKPPFGTLCLFKTENDAKGARNMMKAKGIEVGKEICEVYVDKRYIGEDAENE